MSETFTDTIGAVFDSGEEITIRTSTDNHPVKFKYARITGVTADTVESQLSSLADHGFGTAINESGNGLQVEVWTEE